jgi:NAD(P)H-hydrate epimerase
LRAGAGLVTLACVPAVRNAIAAAVPEVTYLPVPEFEGGIDEPAGDLIARALPSYSALLIGPGLGLTIGAQAVVRGVLTSPAVEALPVVIDADALNALARLPGWHAELRTHAVLTPHPGELARLVNKSVPEVQQARVDIARESAAVWRQTLVLKGAHTIVARPDGQVLVSPYATAALATASTGDVLAGAIAGLIAQGVEPYDAAGLAVYLHGAAAEAFRGDYGHSGLLASELGPAIARAAERLRRGE